MAERLVLRRHPRAAQVVAARARLVAALRAQLDGRGFREARVPVLLPHAGPEPHLQPPPVTLAGLPGPLWLQTSPEQPLRRLVCAGVHRVYALGPAFRGGREELSERHQPEFTLLEWYQPGRSVDALVADCLALGSAAAGALGVVRELPEPIGISVAEACARWTGVELSALLDDDLPRFARALRDAGLAPRPGDDAVRLFSRLVVERLDPALAAVPGWVFLTGFPLCVGSLARTAPGDPRTAQRVEAYLDGVELANGWVEIGDPVELGARWRRESSQRDGSGPPQDGGLLAELAADAPPDTIGMALGVDRLHMVLAGARRLADVLPLWLELEPAGP